jgi:hypothetical protein
MKIRPVGAELLHADGRRNTTMLIVAFRNFAKAPMKLQSRYTVRDTKLTANAQREGWSIIQPSDIPSYISLGYLV